MEWQVSEDNVRRPLSISDISDELEKGMSVIGGEISWENPTSISSDTLEWREV